MTTATGFDCQPLPDGNVLIEFFGDDGKTVNEQVVTPDLIWQMPLVTALTQVALMKGPEVTTARKRHGIGKERANATTTTASPNIPKKARKVPLAYSLPVLQEIVSDTQERR